MRERMGREEVFPSDSDGKNPPAMQEAWVQTLG